MSELLKRWYERYANNSEAIVLVLMLAGGLLLVRTLGAVLAPIIASLVIAYLLIWIVDQLSIFNIPRRIALLGAYAAFMGVFLSLVLFVAPLLWQQLALMFEEMPNMIHHVQGQLNQLPESEV